jgi:very-short-patch-repair endonuclease
VRVQTSQISQKMSENENASSLRLQRARQLRGQMTFPERLLWSSLRNRNLFGLKFRRQVPLGPFVLDYFCADHALCVELDGQSHDGKADADRQREAYLREHKVRVIRVTNDEVLKHREGVLHHIARACGIDPSASERPRTLTPPSP